MFNHSLKNSSGAKAAALVALLSGTLASVSAQAAEYAKVVSSTPVMASVPQARQVCSQGEQVVQQAPSGAGAVIGAIAGGLLGHTVGGGFGRAAATGVGVVAGAAVGNQVEANGNAVSSVPVQRCQTVSSYETRVIGYDVVYEYAGQRYSTRTARDPGHEMAINVQPSDSSNVLPAAGDVGQPVYNSYQTVPSTVYAPAQPVYYAPPAYYAPSPAYYVAPAIGLGLGLGLAYYGGYHHGYYGGGYRHWR